MTPLMIEILLHYWSRCDDFRNGDLSPPAVSEAIAHLVEKNILWEQDAGLTPRFKAEQRALQVYVEAISAVPLPEMQWVIPKE
jgi:hypothetical protein